MAQSGCTSVLSVVYIFKYQTNLNLQPYSKPIFFSFGVIISIACAFYAEQDDVDACSCQSLTIVKIVVLDNDT